MKRMTTQTSITPPVRPRVLIADDSRIVRATLIKHIEGMFEFREARDGEQAWETLLLDQSIRIVITDLTMPKLDGYGLLQRIRSSKISRIRNIPVVVVSGSDESEERERAKAAGATDLITKGIDTGQLLSRLDILVKLVGTQSEFERSVETHALGSEASSQVQLPSSDALKAQVEALLLNAVKYKKNFVMFNLCVGLKQAGLDGVVVPPSSAVIDAVGQLLRRSVRQTDCVGKAGPAEFTLTTSNINPEAARSFALRICRAVTNASLAQEVPISLVASCGLVSLTDGGIDAAQVSLQELRDIAHRRALQGLNRTFTGVVGEVEELALERGERIQGMSEREGGIADADSPAASGPSAFLG